MNICGELLCYFIFSDDYWIFLGIIPTSEPGIVCVCNKYIFFLLAEIMPLLIMLGICYYKFSTTLFCKKGTTLHFI